MGGKSKDSARGARWELFLGTSVMANHAKECEKLSTQLHDGPSQHLAALSFRLDALAGQLSGPSLELLESCSNILRAAFDDVHTLSKELEPISMEPGDLVCSAQTYLERKSVGTPGHVTFEADESVVITLEQEDDVLQCLQFVIHDALYRCKAEAVQTRLTLVGEQPAVEVEYTNHTVPEHIARVFATYCEILNAKCVALQDKLTLILPPISVD